MTELPDHWGLQRLKYVSQHIVEKRFPVEGDIKISPENVESNTGRILDFYSDYDSEGQEFLPGDILFNKLRVYLNKVVLTDFAGLSMGEMIVFRPRKICPEYLSKVMTSKIFIDEINSLSEGVKLPRPPIEGIMNSFVPVPPPEEQKLISLYLDKKIEQIDSLVEKIQRKIELLKEQRKSLINRCITKGLDPNVEMKDSGIEWIGAVPDHWVVKKITHVVVSIGSGTTPKSDNSEYYEDGTINWLVTGDLNDGLVNQTSHKITEKAVKDYFSLKSFPSDSLLIAMYGATIGKLGILKTESTVNQATCVISFDNDNDIHFWFYTFLSHRQYLTSLRYGGGQPNISQELIKGLRFPVPPLTEQKQISRYLDKKTEQIDSLIQKIQKKIELLKEYRQSLILSVVTGKVRITEDMI